MSREKIFSQAFVAFKVLVVGLCLYLAYVSGKWGLADYYYSQCQQAMKTWDKDPPTVDAWRDAYTPLQQALNLDSTNPVYNDWMGRLYHARWNLDPTHAKQWGELSKQAFRQSLAVRPKWPLTWANLALMKVDLGEYDGKLDRAVLNATQYGPWEPGVHQIVALIGAQGLFHFNPKIQSAIVANDARGLISPVPGSAQVVADTLANTWALDRPIIWPRIGAALLARHWQDDHFKRYRMFSRVTFEFWQYFPASLQQQLLAKVVGVADDPQVVRLAAKDQRLGDLCPRLSPGKLFDQYCARSRN